MAYVYRHIRLDKNEPFYIGIGSDSEYKRAHTHHSRNAHWKNIVNITAYEVEILIDNVTWEIACEKEKEFITLYGRRDLDSGPLVNLTEGGEGVLGMKFSQETLSLLSKQRTGRKQSPETIKKRAAKLSGPGNPWYGKTFPAWYRKKLSDAKLGKPRNPEVMERLHEATRKKIINIETGEIYNSIGDAAKAVNVSGSTMGRWVKNPKKPFNIYNN